MNITPILKPIPIKCAKGLTYIQHKTDNTRYPIHRGDHSNDK